MVTRQDYFNLKDAALDHYNHLRYSQPTGTDIIFVVTEDILAAIFHYDADNQVYTSFDFVREQVYTRLCGVDIVIVRGDELGTLFTAAIRCDGRLYIDTRIANGTYLIVDECLYRYEAETLRFVEIGCQVLTGFDASRINTDAMVSFDFSAGNIMNQTNAVQTDVSINYDTLYNAMMSTRSINPKKTKEPELSPGNTKMLDDYLCSFKRSMTQRGNE